MLYLKEYIEEMIKDAASVAIMGVGSELCADDAAGMMLVGRLEQTVGDLPQVLLLAGSTAPENFTGEIKKFAPGRLFIIDAAHLKEEPGAIGIVDPTDIGGIDFSTHTLPLPVMVDYLKAESGCEVSVLGIQPQNTKMFAPVCPQVASAVEEITQTFTECLRAKYL